MYQNFSPFVDCLESNKEVLIFVVGAVIKIFQFKITVLSFTREWKELDE